MGVLVSPNHKLFNPGVGVLVSPNHKLFNPGVGVMLSTLCAWIVISAMSAHVNAEEVQALTNETTQSSLGIISEKADDELNTPTITAKISTHTNEVDNRLGTANLEYNPNTTTNPTIDSSPTNINDSVHVFIVESNTTTDTTNTTDDTSSQSALTTQTTQVSLSETIPNVDETTAQQSEADTNNTPTETATEDWLNSSSVASTASEASDVTRKLDLSTLPHQNTCGILDVENCTKTSGLGTLGIIVVTCIAVAAVVIIIFVIAFVLYFSRAGGCCKRKRQIEGEYVDCDHELYSSLNSRHHGARADYQPLNLKDEELITKMEVDEIEDTEDTVIDLDEPADSGRYLSPEGLVYITIAHEHANGQKKASNKIKKDDNRVQYASVDINKTNKLFMKLQKRERNKKRKTESKKEIENKETRENGMF